VTTISAVLLAAGESRRMGRANKLELPVDGVPLLRRTVKTLLASRLEEVVVVTGFEADNIVSLLQGLPVNVIHNERFLEGQMTSVYRGLKGLSQACDGVMIALADQALLTSDDVNRLADAFDRYNRPPILVPVHKGQRGNPIILDHGQREAILRGERNLGCKRLIERNPDLVMTVEMDSEHFVIDIDTPEDYVALQHRRQVKGASKLEVG
jgi:molybdenum cofactor cytidylyltransferase